MATATDTRRNVPKPSDALDAPALLRLLSQMMLIRRFEERTAQSYQQAAIGGFCHLYIGQEAAAVGSIAALRADDPVITAYRDHGHALARGMDPKYAMAEMFGKLAGCCKGKGGSMHLFDKPHHMYGGHAIVGGQCPLGVGIAFSIRYLKEDKVCACFLGDGALNIGAFHEAMNMAGLWNLPIIFICENNLYSMGTHIARGTTKADDLSVKAAAYGMRFAACDGMDVLATYDCIKPLAESIRAGGVPAFVDCQTYRYKGHSMSDPQKYRAREEVTQREEQHDPILVLTRHMLTRGMASQQQIDQLDAEAKKTAVEALRYAESAEATPLSEMFTDVYAMPYEPYKLGQPPELMRDAEGGQKS